MNPRYGAMPKRKGMSLPLETVILLILAAVVLAALLAFFRSAFAPAQTESQAVQDQLRICQEIAQDGVCEASEASKLLTSTSGGAAVCRVERPSCSPGTSGDRNKNCVQSCCKIYCTRVT